MLTFDVLDFLVALLLDGSTWLFDVAEGYATLSTNWQDRSCRATIAYVGLPLAVPSDKRSCLRAYVSAPSTRSSSLTCTAIIVWVWFRCCSLWARPSTLPSPWSPRRLTFMGRRAFESWFVATHSRLTSCWLLADCRKFVDQDHLPARCCARDTTLQDTRTPPRRRAFDAALFGTSSQRACVRQL